jgi:hypothetical protein
MVTMMTMNPMEVSETTTMSMVETEKTMSMVPVEDMVEAAEITTSKL